MTTMWVVFPRLMDGVGVFESSRAEAWQPRRAIVSFPRGGQTPPAWEYSRCFLLGPFWTEPEVKIFARQMGLLWAPVEVRDEYMGRLTPLQRSTTAAPGNT